MVLTVDRSTSVLLLSLLLHALVWWWLSQIPPGGGAPPPPPTEVTYVDAPPKEPKSKARYVDHHPAAPQKEPEDLHDAAALISNLNRRYKKQMIAANTGPEINSPSKSAAANATRERKAADTRAERPPERGGELALPRFGADSHRPAIGPSSTQMRVPWVDFGDLSVLNSDRSTYYVFYERMSEQVGNRWSRLVREMIQRTPVARLQEMSKADRRTVVEIVLGPDGDFVRSHFENGSGFQDLDYTGVEAFRMATPFVNPPKGMVGKDGLIHVHVAFEVIMRPPMLGNGY